MTQAIHIILKDARRWRWLIALELAIIAARTTIAPGDSAFRHSSIFSNLPDLLDMLQLVAWWFLIAVVIHEESLDVNREFWFTRPYSWRSLVAAKTLFIVLFILAPECIADVLILAVDGFSIRPLLLDLFWFECLRLMFLLPGALLAAVSSGTRQFLLGILLLILAFYTVVQFATPDSPIQDSSAAWPVMLLIVIPAVLTFWQYWQRRTWLTRGIAAAAFLSLLIPAAYSVSAIGAPHPEIGIRFDPQSRGRFPMPAGHRSEVVEVVLPISITGRDRNLVDPTLISARIDSGGSQWQTRWSWYDSITTTSSDWLHLTIPARDYDRLKRTAATVYAEVAVTLYDLERTATVPTGGPWMSLGAAGQTRLRWDGRGLIAERRLPLYDSGYRVVYGQSIMTEAASSGRYPRQRAEAHMSSVFFRGAWLGTFPFRSVNLLVERPVGRIKRTLTIRDVPLDDWVIAR
jgi:hypothetical protein